MNYNKIEQKNKKNGVSGTVSLLQVGAVLLASVSFWATAQGMKNYVFEESWQAYAASLAIQGILLGLNFYLPSFLSNTKWLLKTAIILLTCIVMFCSSWFSYVFIAGKVYDKSWDTESRLLIQNTYRQVLFDSNDYSKAYRNILANNLSNQINSIYDLSKNFDEVSVENENEIDWDSERDLYASGNITGDKMSVVINDMENAMVDGASQEIRDQLATTLESVSSEFQSRLVTIESKLKTARESLEITSGQIRDAQNADEINSEYIAELQSQMTSYAENITALSNEQIELDSALDRIGYYRILFTRIEGGNTLQLSVILQNIQKELVSNNPNVSSIESQASDLFNLLQQSSNIFENQDVTYSQLLSMVSTLVYDIEDYALVSSSSEKLQETVENLANADFTSNVDTEKWKNEWQNKIAALQNIISVLPGYTQKSDLDNMNFDKAEASKQLDEMIRLYIADHNAAHQGLIYITSPYWPLALFSLVLAFFFDISGFVVGVIIFRIDNQEKIESIQNNENENESSKLHDTNQDLVVSNLQNKYLFFTGDYEKIGSKYVYKAFVDTKNEDVVFDSPKDFDNYLYIESQDGFYIPSKQDICYSSISNQAKDGVYLNCSLSYDNGMLMISEEQDDNYKFLSHISNDIPVYILGDDYIDVLSSNSLSKQQAEIAVLALNETGNAISAIYIK